MAALTPGGNNPQPLSATISGPVQRPPLTFLTPQPQPNHNPRPLARPTSTSSPLCDLRQKMKRVKRWDRVAYNLRIDT